MTWRLLGVVLLVGMFWVALPGVALAGYCPDDPGLYCLLRGGLAWWLGPAIGMGMAAASLMGAFGSPAEPPDYYAPRGMDDPMASFQPPPPLPPPIGPHSSQPPSPDPDLDGLDLQR